MRGHHERLKAKHPSVGSIRNLGLFGIIDLVRSRDPWTWTMTGASAGRPGLVLVR
jgi:4-aminobutyrate aminotransferase-like enzyme